MNRFRSLMINPKYTIMRGLARFSFFRNTVVVLRKLLTYKKSQRLEEDLVSNLHKSIFKTEGYKEKIRELKTKGSSLGLYLPKEYTNKLLEFSAINKLYAYREEKLGFDLDDRLKAEEKIGKEILLAQYFNVLKDCPTVKKIIEDPLVKLIALKYLESPPCFLGVNLWWTFPTTPDPAVQKKNAHFFHRDIDDFKFLKFFFYLTDVEKNDGAHWLVLNSHRIPPHIKFKDRFLTRRFTDEEIFAFYPNSDIKEIIGNKSTGFVEDTLSVHKGATPAKNPRLLLQFQFGLFNFLPENNDYRDPKSLEDII